MRHLQHDLSERAQTKQASRDADALALARGEKSRAQLAKDNSPFSALLQGVRYDRVGLPRYRAR